MTKENFITYICFEHVNSNSFFVEKLLKGSNY